MSWAAFLPQNVAQHPTRFVGPNIAGTVAQALETGILMNQSIRFWSRSSGEPLLIKILVSFVSVVAVFQTAIAFYNTWRVVVLGFGDWFGIVFLQWPDRIQPALTCLMAAPFQAFLIWRCWSVMQRRWIILIPLVSLLLATIVMNFVITVRVFVLISSPFAILRMSVSEPPREFITAFVLTAVLDICITSLMFWYLYQARSHVVSRRFDKILGRLLRILWEAALPPCACAIAACVVYITMSFENLWDIFLQSILGKLYVISLFVILNGRADLRDTPPAVTAMNTSAGLTRYWATRAPAEFRLQITGIEYPNNSVVEFTPTTAVSHLDSRVETAADLAKDVMKGESDSRLSDDRGIGEIVFDMAVLGNVPSRLGPAGCQSSGDTTGF